MLQWKKRKYYSVHRSVYANVSTITLDRALCFRITTKAENTYDTKSAIGYYKDVSRRRNNKNAKSRDNKNVNFEDLWDSSVSEICFRSAMRFFDFFPLPLLPLVIPLYCSLVINWALKNRRNASIKRIVSAAYFKITTKIIIIRNKNRIYSYHLIKCIITKWVLINYRFVISDFRKTHICRNIHKKHW